MDAIRDWKSAAAGDDQAVGRTLATGTTGEARAPAESFVGRDNQRAIDEIAVEIQVADAAGVHRLREIIVDRMDLGDLSSLTAMRLLQAAASRTRRLNGASP
jgi:hypothetical protein